jgi:ATP-dependent RNA helicase RhlE
MSQSCTALGVSEPLVRVLTQRNIHSPFAVQELALPDALAGLDILAQSPTGSGKTLAFGLPLASSRARSCSSRPASWRPRSQPT